MKETVEKILIEENGIGGFDSYHVPGIITSSNGDLLLTYEGRRGNGNERALFLRRCRLGRNEKWTEKTEENRRGIGDPTERADKNIANTHQYIQIGERIVMAEQKTGELLHNPLLIAGPSGHVWFFWCQDYGRLFLRESADHGASFGPVRELTAAIDGFRRDWPVTLWSIAPGHGICMKDGTVVLPLWLSRGENAHLPACFACLFSRDQGKTWECSSVVPAGNGVGDPTEASVAERMDGTLLATMRHEIRGSRKRAFCGGGPVGWGPAWLNPKLPDPICHGALLSIGEAGMLFVNCSYEDEPALLRQKAGEDVRWSLDARQKLTIRLSMDDGKSWSDGLMIEKEAGASDLAKSEDNHLIYCFYEEGWADGNCIFNRNLKLAQLPLRALRLQELKLQASETGEK